MTEPCQARSDSAGQMRCAKCQVTWDRDDVMVCPQETTLAPVVATRDAGESLANTKRVSRFVSALAPDRFSRR